VGTLLDDALDVCDLARLRNDPWQEGALDAILSVDSSGLWAATEFGLLVSRQQGKGNILLDWELAHMFLWPRPDGAPKLIGHTAHETRTAREAFLRCKRTILGSPVLRKQLLDGGKRTQHGVTGVSTGNGNWSIELENGNRLQFFTRTGGAGVGLSFDVLIVDEAQHSPLNVLEALLPTTDASPNKQVLFTGTVPKEDQDGEYFEGLRDRGRAGGVERSGWIEHTPVGSDDPDTAEKLNLGDVELWRQANPGLGIRLAFDTVSDDWSRMGHTNPEAFARQRLSIWPNRRPDEVEHLSDLDIKRWRENVEPDAQLGDVCAIAIALGRGGSFATVAAASRLDDEHIFVEHERTSKGVAWVAAYVRDLKKKLNDALVVVDPKNAAPILMDLDAVKVKRLQMGMDEVAAAHAMFIEASNSALVVHRGQDEVTRSLELATVRPVGRAGFTWAASDESKPISHAQAVTWALWGLRKREAMPPRRKPIVRGYA
jgi:phage terminase large subunit-like protein